MHNFLTNPCIRELWDWTTFSDNKWRNSIYNVKTWLLALPFKYKRDPVKRIRKIKLKTNVGKKKVNIWAELHSTVIFCWCILAIIVKLFLFMALPTTTIFNGKSILFMTTTQAISRTTGSNWSLFVPHFDAFSMSILDMDMISTISYFLIPENLNLIPTVIIMCNLLISHLKLEDSLTFSP